MLLRQDVMDNPLMAQEDSKWSKYFAAQELRDEIMNDIERTYPEFEFFRLESTQKCLCQVLYIWAAMNPRISYKQGMNELLAPIVFVMSQEYTDPRQEMAPGSSIGVISLCLVEHAVVCHSSCVRNSHDSFQSCGVIR